MQHFQTWISFLGKFLQNSYLLLNSFTCLCVKDVLPMFYWKLIVVIYMSNQRSYCKQMTLPLIMLLNIYSSDRSQKNTKISFCHWNLNALTAHNFSKLSLLQAMATTHEYDIICLSVMLLNWSFNSLDDWINIERYNHLIADHPNNNKTPWLCMYFKKHLSILRRRN